MYTLHKTVFQRCEPFIKKCPRKIIASSSVHLILVAHSHALVGSQEPENLLHFHGSFFFENDVFSLGKSIDNY